MPRKGDVCKENDAAVPDRNRTGKPIKRICRQCHMARLQGDLQAIMNWRRRRNPEAPRDAE